MAVWFPGLKSAVLGNTDTFFSAGSRTGFSFHFVCYFVFVSSFISLSNIHIHELEPEGIAITVECDPVHQMGQIHPLCLILHKVCLKLSVWQFFFYPTRSTVCMFCLPAVTKGSSRNTITAHPPVRSRSMWQVGQK